MFETVKDLFTFTNCTPFGSRSIPFEDSDIALLRRAQNGDTLALQELTERYLRRNNIPHIEQLVFLWHTMLVNKNYELKEFVKERFPSAGDHLGTINKTITLNLGFTAINNILQCYASIYDVYREIAMLTAIDDRFEHSIRVCFLEYLNINLLRFEPLTGMPPLEYSIDTNMDWWSQIKHRVSNIIGWNEATAEKIENKIKAFEACRDDNNAHSTAVFILIDFMINSSKLPNKPAHFLQQNHSGQFTLLEKQFNQEHQQKAISLFTL